MAGDTARINEEAAAWVGRLDSGAWSDDLEAELQAWLALSPRHRGALLQTQAAWASLDVEALAPTSDGPDLLVEPEKLTSTVNRRGFFAVGGAAIAASGIGSFAWLSSRETYETDVGEIRRIPLEDGSIAAINTASKFDIKLAAKRREIRIKHGEVWFQVSKNPSRPFVVEAGDIRVVAVGTAFSVRRRANGADILVTEGVIRAWAGDADGHSITLTEGQRAFVADNSAIIREVSEPATVDRLLAWRSGRIDLAGQTLIEAIEEFNRYNRRQIVLIDQRLGNEQFDGTFRTDDIEGFAKAVKMSLNVAVDFADPRQIRIG